MEIQLHNFRCHRKAEFSLPDKGLTLISGPSGQGKTTLLNAISYAFYGEIRRPYTHGKKGCSVKLKFRDMDIIRSSRPNRLILKYKGEEYEDEPAQKMIERVLGMNYSEFLASSYVVQRKGNSVLTMSPTEQLKFVETLAFSNNTHKEYKIKFKDNVKEKQENKIRCETKLDMLKSRLEEAIQKAPKALPPREELGNLEEVEETEVILKDELMSLKTDFQYLQDELKQLRKKEKEQEEVKSEIQKLEVQISSLEQRKVQAGDEVTSEDIEEQEKELKKVSAQLLHTKHYEEYTKNLAKVKKLEKEHQESLKRKIQELKKIIPSRKGLSDLKKERDSLEALQKEYTEKSVEAEAFQRQRREALEIFQQIQKEAGLKLKSSKAVIRNLKNKKTKLEPKIRACSKKVTEYNQRCAFSEIENRVYECPSCSVKLKVQGFDLKKEEEVQSESQDCSDLLKKEEETLQDLQAQHQKLEIWLQKLESVQPALSKKMERPKPIDISHFQDLERKLIEIEKAQEEVKELQKAIRTKVFPLAIQVLWKELQNQKGLFPSKFKPKNSISELEKEVSDLEEQLDRNLRTQGERSSLSREIKALERELRSLQKSQRKLKKRTSRQVEEEITRNQTRVSEVVDQIQEVSTAKNYLQQYKLIEIVDALKNLVQNAQKNLEEAEIKLRGALGLQEAGKEAEIKALSQTMSSINEHAKIYLEQMFDETIQVRLENFRLTKSNTVKNQMNVVVEYKGQVYNSVDELSGGEKQRCELAFLLAVNDMIGSRIILLDECLNNLDSEVNMKVLTDLRELLKDKLVIVVSHLAVKGIFNTMISI